MTQRSILASDAVFPGFRNQNNITIGSCCPGQDFVRFEKLARQNRERIPERGLHQGLRHAS